MLLSAYLSRDFRLSRKGHQKHEYTAYADKFNSHDVNIPNMAYVNKFNSHYVTHFTELEAIS